MSKCCICNREADAENAPILTMSAYGNPRYLCPECEAAVDTAHGSTDPEEISRVCEYLGRSMTLANVEESVVIESVNGIIEAAAKKADAIKAGSYSPEEDEEQSPDEEFELTEDLLETEEDRARDEKDARMNKIFDTVIAWASGIIIAASVLYLIIKFAF